MQDLTIYSHFRCLLTPRFPALMPVAFKNSLPHFTSQDKQGFFVNPRMIYQDTPQLPENIQARIPFLGALSLSYPILWVKEPIHDLLLPYWPDPEMQTLVQSLIQTQRIPIDLADETFHNLVLAGILMASPLAAYQQYQAEENHTRQERVIQEKYLIFHQLLNPLMIAALREHYRVLADCPAIQTQKDEETDRTYYRNEPMTRYLHYQIAAFITQVTPEPIQPSYTFTSYYKEVGMRRHRDHSLCAWNLSVLVDPEPEIEPTSRWPFFLELDDDTLLEVRLDPGDAVMYKGTDLTHWREDLPAGHRATVSLFHFVSRDFEGEIY